MNAIASMAAIVTSGQRIWYAVRSQVRANRPGDTRSQAADATAARRMPVPVADSQATSNRASSGRGAGTTGALRTIAWCTPGTSH